MTTRLHPFIGVAVAATLALPAVSAAEDPGTFKVPGTETTLKLYGFVQLYATYDVSGRIGDIENYDWASIPAVQPLHDTPQAKETGQFYLTARTSRVGIQSTTPTPLGALETKLEADFNGPNAFQGQTFTNSVLFRLRHAYASLHGFLVGQTWTLFLDFPSAPDTVDFNGPGTLALVRQPQLRYTFQATPELSVAASAENPRNGGVGHIPDFVVKASYQPTWGSAGLGFLTNQYRFDKAGDSTPRSGTRQGWGLALSGSYKLWNDTAVALLVGGDGIGRYLFNDAAGQFAGASDSGSLRLWRVWAYHLGYTHVWNQALRSNAVWSQTFFSRNGISEATFPAADDESTGTFVPNRRIDQLFLNSFWGITRNAEVGLEYELARRHTFGNRTGNEDRITASATYKFF